MATCLAETILETAATSGFTKLSERDKLSVMLQSFYEASESSDTVQQLMDASTAFSKVGNIRYKACILLQLMISKEGGTSSASQILANAALSQFMFLSDTDKKAAALQLMCDYNDIGADAASFFSRASITDATQRSAIITFIAALKAADLWDSAVAIYPIVGGTNAQHAINLKADTFEITWVGTPVSSSQGIRSDGTAYGLTGIQRQDLGASYSLSIYQPVASAGGFDMAISNYSAAGTGDTRELSSFDLATNGYFRFGDGTDFLTGATTNSGILTGCLSGTGATLFRNSPTPFQTGTATGLSADDPTFTFGVLARWNQTTASIHYQTNVCLFAFFNEGIASKIFNWNAAVTALQTSLGRAV